MREEARLCSTIYGPFSHFQGSEKKKSSYLGKLLLWEMETTTNNIVFTFAPIAEEKKINGSASMTLQKRKNIERLIDTSHLKQP